MRSIGVYHSAYHNKRAFKFAFETFRKFFPDTPYVIYSDTGDDFSEYVNINTHYRRANIRFYGTGPNAFWYDNWEIWESYYGRIKDSCEICNTDYMLVMEDDVLITKKFELSKDFDVAGPCRAHLPYNTIKFIEKYLNRPMYSTHYGLCGGAMFNTKKFLDNYDKIISNLKMLHYEYSDNLKEPIAIVGDGNFVIQFNLLGFKYECLEHIINTGIIHPFKQYYES